MLVIASQIQIMHSFCLKPFCGFPFALKTAKCGMQVLHCTTAGNVIHINHGVDGVPGVVQGGGSASSWPGLCLEVQNSFIPVFPTF